MTTTAAPPVSTPLLSDNMLARFEDRAATYDRENTFCHEDFDELRDAGYLKLAVPEEFGGLGANLTRVAGEQRRLAYHAPATALATNMHFYWTGVMADLHRAGDTTCDFLLQEAAAGAVFAAGHGERGNDLPLLLSSTQAERVDGGYRITGHKSFGSLTPVWTRLGLHAMDASDPDAPKIVHAFMKRDAEGYRIDETWDALGMRATRSDDTILEGVFVPDEDVAYVVPAGAAGTNLFVLGIFAWAETTFSSIYLGLAERAKDIAAEQLQTKSSMAIGQGLYKFHPEFQHAFAEIVMKLDLTEALVQRYADEWSTEVLDAPNWTPETLLQVRLALDEHEAPGDERRLRRRRRRGRRGRRLRCLPWRHARAAVPRRSDGPPAPRQLRTHARADREGAPGHRPRRPAALGVADGPGRGLAAETPSETRAHARAPVVPGEVRGAPRTEAVTFSVRP